MTERGRRFSILRCSFFFKIGLLLRQLPILPASRSQDPVALLLQYIAWISEGKPL
jgi:hypothetical protein